MPDHATRVISFAEFRVDLRAGELRRNGTRIKLQNQPFQILTMLLERPGDIVTRDEMRARLWPAETFVDFDHGLNSAVRRLRDALGDSADQPVFIETLGRRGYRFVFPAEKISSNQGNGNAPVIVMPTSVALPEMPSVSSASVARQRKRLRPLVLAGLVVVVAGETHAIALPDGFHPLVQSWFPDSSHVALSQVTTDGKPPNLWVLSILGGSPRQLVENGAAARVSPDGSQVFFLRSAVGRNELWMMQADGDHQRKILSDSTADQVYFSPIAWAPDGHRAAFIRTVLPVYNAADPTGAKKTLEMLDPATGRSEVVVTNQELEGAFGWANENTLLYTLHELPPNQNDFTLWRIHLAPNTSRPRGDAAKLATGYGWAAELNVASDGKSAALRRVEPNADVYLAEVDLNTKYLSPKRLTLDDRADYVFGWTADSHSILFLSDRDGPLRLYKQALNQTQPELLVGGNNILAIPRISPSGTDVFYLQMPHHGDTSANVKIMRVPLTGGVPQRILEAIGIWNYQCAQLPATLCIYSPTDAHVQKFFAFDPATGASHEITSAQVSAEPERPNWSLSPDGSRLATRVQRADSDAGIRVLSLSDGSQATIPLPGWPRMGGIDWASDGQSLWIAASSSRANGPRNCALLNLSTSGAIRVVFQDDSLCFLAGIPSPDGRQLALEGVRPDSSNVWLLENF